MKTEVEGGVTAVFVDRRDAGLRLGERLRGLQGTGDVVVLGLPRGGVPVAFQVARALGAPLDVIVVRKLGVPYQPELGFGAIGEGGVRVVNPDVVRLANITRDEMAEVERRERAELERRARRFRAGHEPVDLAGRTVIVVDDGIATGGTARAACQVARAHGPSRVVLAVPVGAPETIASLRRDADEVVCLDTPDHFYAIGSWYDDFTQASDEDVVECLRLAGGQGLSGDRSQ
ncbi:phosphoribosyltransferase [Microbispora bryophytorum]|uniref:phosphoribosyltransferase n=1 Tax=Microbispora bryophytorum TaxID=1460882 RepID=UPI00295EE9D9|nr:phosphoribosyltransferase [Microbispora camponoti]